MKLKVAIIISPLLALPQFSLLFTIETDALDTGGVGMIQEGRPIALFLKKIVLKWKEKKNLLTPKNRLQLLKQ